MSSASKVTLLMACLALGSCSALGLDEYDIIQCDLDSTDGSPECDALNATLPPDSCGRFYCSSTGRGCVFEERRNEEVCDGLDNDCDRAIDEEAEVPEEDQPQQSPPLDDLVRVSPAAADDGTLHVLLTREPEPDSVAPRLSHLAITEVVTMEQEAPKASCLAGYGKGTQDCLIEDLAIAATSKTLVGAGFHRSTCGAGQLRVGIGSTTAFDLDLGETARDVRAGAAIDIVKEQGCTVSARCAGGYTPAIALLPAAGTALGEALVLWQAPNAPDASACPGAEDFAIAAVRLPLEGEGADARFRGAIDESSSLLSAHAATGAPQLVPVLAGEQAGFLAAFPSGDRIELAFIPRAGADVAALTSINGSIGARAASDVALAGSDFDRGWAAAYRTETDGEVAIQLRVLMLDERRVSAVGPAITLRERAEILAGPALAYAPDGFSTDEPTGGWAVAWVESAPSDSGSTTRLMLRRIAEAGHRMLGEPVELADGDDLSLPFIYLKHESRSRTALRCAFLESEALHVRRASCMRE